MTGRHAFARKKGYSARDVENILGGNILRVVEQVERVARGGS